MTSVDSDRRITRLCQAAVALWFAFWVALLARAMRHDSWFDDAYMFYRYAMNMRHGLGMSWNLDGVHSYGETALLWGWIVFVLSYLPLKPSQVLAIGSWTCSVLALVAIVWAVGRGVARSRSGDQWRLLAVIAVSLACTENYLQTSVLGMETMLGVALCAAYVGAVLQWGRNAGSPELAGFTGVLLFLTRPEAGAVVVLFPSLYLVVWRRGSVSGLLRLLGVFFAGLVAVLLMCKVYFKTALPLSFYMKSSHGYEGYAKYQHPTVSFFDFLSGCLAYVLVLVLLSRRQDRRMLICFGVPLFVMAIYLNFVLQIMGNFSRYYLPYCGLLVVPALLLVLERLQAGANWWRIAPEGRWMRFGVSAFLLWPFLAPLRDRLPLAIDHRLEHKQFAYDPVIMQTASSIPLPAVSFTRLWQSVPEAMFAALPPGATFASSEVGFVGVTGLRLNVIDLAGLNDTDIAEHGFRVSALLARKPDAIWLPHPDYTWQRGVMLTDQDFLRQYEIFAGAADSGIAIRRDGPYRAQLETGLQTLWSQLYPGFTMPDYFVTGTSWSGKKHTVIDRD